MRKNKGVFSEMAFYLKLTLLEAEVLKNREKSPQTYQLGRPHDEYVGALYSVPFQNLPVPFFEVET